jgi:hypothetical protein
MIDGARIIAFGEMKMMIVLAGMRRVGTGLMFLNEM